MKILFDASIFRLFCRRFNRIYLLLDVACLFCHFISAILNWIWHERISSLTRLSPENHLKMIKWRQKRISSTKNENYEIFIFFFFLLLSLVIDSKHSEIPKCCLRVSFQLLLAACLTLCIFDEWINLSSSRDFCCCWVSFVSLVPFHRLHRLTQIFIDIVTHISLLLFFIFCHIFMWNDIVWHHMLLSDLLLFNSHHFFFCLSFLSLDSLSFKNSSFFFALLFRSVICWRQIRCQCLATSLKRINVLAYFSIQFGCFIFCFVVFYSPKKPTRLSNVSHIRLRHGNRTVEKASTDGNGVDINSPCATSYLYENGLCRLSFVRCRCCCCCVKTKRSPVWSRKVA